MIGVDVVDVDVGRAGKWFARGGHDLKRDFCSAGESDDGRAAVANEPIGRCDHAAERRRDRGAVELGQYGVEGCAGAVTGDQNRNIFEVEAGVARLAAALARPAGKIWTACP